MNCYHGTILTCDNNNTVASYLVEKDGIIQYVGNDLPQEYANAPVHELGSKTLIPSFTDTHQHFASFATFHAGLNVMEATSNQEILDMVRRFAASAKGKMLVAFGASPYSVAEGRLVNREELDSVCPDKPLMMVKYDGHACIVNTPLLNMLNDKLKDQRGYHPDTGEMNQEAFFVVSDHMSSSLSIPELIGNMQRAMDHMASKGIGLVHTVSGIGFPMDMDISMEQWVGRSAQSGFQLRVFPQSLSIKTATSRGLPRIGGCFATALDGCFGSQDAALKAPYLGTDDKGVLYYDDEKVTAFCKEANRAGLQIEIHAIGDAAFDQATRCLKAALDDYPREDHRHGIIHACLPTKEGLEICRKYHIQLPMQSAFIGWKQEPDAYLESILGERAAALNPLRTIWDMGIMISAGSDAPCTDPDPIEWIYKACNHSVPEESLTIQEALRMCTYNGAWTTFDEQERGSLEAGKVADMVILNQNPYATPTQELNRLKVEQLYLQGKPYQNQKQGILAAVFKGMLAKKHKI
ncbi:MAG: amidohydrolase family protein [Clostridia bacterium]|nr:amidohydrolase family protein [Clostridia bacterium]